MLTNLDKAREFRIVLLELRGKRKEIAELMPFPFLCRGLESHPVSIVSMEQVDSIIARLTRELAEFVSDRAPWLMPKDCALAAFLRTGEIPKDPRL